MDDVKKMNIHGVDIAFRDSGGNGRALVFIHGNSASSQSFSRLWNAPLGGLRRIAIDLPGHGDSADAADPDRTYTLPGYGAAVSATLDRLGVDDVVLVGHSLGGHVAMEVAALRGDVAGLMAVGTPPLPANIEKAMGAFLPVPMLEILFKGQLDADEVDRFAAAIYAPNPDIPAITADHVRRTDPRCRECLGASVGAVNFMDEVDWAIRTGIPLALVVGRDDPVINVDYMKGLELKGLFRDQVILVEGGHAPFWDHAEDFAALLDDFVGSLG